MKHILRAVGALSLMATSFGAFATEPLCNSAGAMSLQLLGSGGPISDDARASSGEVIWIDGKSRLLIDAGGGTYLRFGQAGARLEDLRFIGISHFHTDHSADLPALLKGGYFMATPNTVTLAGPTGSDAFPGMTAFFKDMFGAGTGSFAYLEGLHDGSDGLQLTVKPIEDVDTHAAQRSLVYQDADVKVYAFGIPHGVVPTLAFRVEGKHGTIVISADQNGSRAGFVDFAKGADILVMPVAIDDDANQGSRFLHAPPSMVGKLAAAIQPKMLVLNHFMGSSLKNKDGNVRIIQRYYHGPIAESRDLSCYPVPEANRSHR
ncbi:MBL fold metallo-hydrolase [Luteibacter sp. E-22]|uniref:MBL fold metallo-hydrolase n=1 Tax=Luteibacter sp. E-22 TaxID=3404050 RepID=UPI003CF19FF1